MIGGHGLAWAPGDFVQGYSNFLWVMIVAGTMALGFEPVAASMGLGLALFVVTLSCTWALALRMLESTSLALCTVIVVAGNYSFLAYATGGLETQLHAALISIAALFAWIVSNSERLRLAPIFGLSVTLGLAGLTRLDSAIFIMAFGAVALWEVMRRCGPGRSAVMPALSLVLPGTLIMVIYFAWSYSTYGNILPNTFSVKSGTLRTDTLIRGGIFVIYFGLVYGFVFVAFGTIRAWPLLFRDPFRIALLAAVSMWTVYITIVGGDFMEFRLFVVCIPFLALFAIDLLNTAGFVPGRLRGIGVAATTAPFLILSAAHGIQFERILEIESVRELEKWVRQPERNWIGIGKELRNLFPGGYASGPTIASTAIGAISFYSKLDSVDMLGLNDAWIAHNGIVIGSKPAHSIGHR